MTTNYLADKRDLATLREGLRLGRKLGATAAFEKFRSVEVYPGPSVQSDEELDQYIRDTVHTSNALVGTCRMGPPLDPLAVVDSSLKVHASPCRPSKGAVRGGVSGRSVEERGRIGR